MTKELQETKSLTICSSDDREGLPSASEFFRIHACHGYLSLKSKIPKEEDFDEAQEFGNSVHEYLADNEIELDADGFMSYVVEKCREIADSHEKAIFQADPSKVMHERRLWYAKDGAKIISGKPDRVSCTNDGKYLIIDYKSLHGEVAPARNNWQIMVLAVALQDSLARSDEFKDWPTMVECYGLIVQPLVDQSPTPVRISPSKLKMAARIINESIELSREPDAQRIPGKHCHHCPCRAHCPEANALVSSKLEVLMSNIDSMGPAELSRIVPHIGWMRSVLDKAWDRSKQMAIDKPGSIDGYKIREENGMLKVVDIKGLRDDTGSVFTKEEFASFLKFDVSSAAKAYADRHKDIGLKTKGEATKQFKQFCEVRGKRGAPIKKLVKDESSTG